MARTFRRRHYIGAEVCWEYVCVYDRELRRTIYCGYIKLEGEALKKSIRAWHSEKRHTYGYSPPKYHRRDTSVTQRMFDKMELVRYKQNNEYEPMCFDKMPMEYWD